MSPPHFCSIEEFAALLGVGQTTVRRLIRSGTIPALRVGRQFRINEGQAIAALTHHGLLL